MNDLYSEALRKRLARNTEDNPVSRSLSPDEAQSVTDYVNNPTPLSNYDDPYEADMQRMARSNPMDPKSLMSSGNELEENPMYGGMMGVGSIEDAGGKLINAAGRFGRSQLAQTIADQPQGSKLIPPSDPQVINMRKQLAQQMADDHPTVKDPSMYEKFLARFGDDKRTLNKIASLQGADRPYSFTKIGKNHAIIPSFDFDVSQNPNLGTSAEGGGQIVQPFSVTNQELDPFAWHDSYQKSFS